MVQALKKWMHYLLPKDFLVYTNNHALSFLNGQEKLNQRHLKWVEYLQAFTFVIKHKKGVSNKIVDAHSRRVLGIQEVQLQSVGMKGLSDLYKEEKDFKEVYEVCVKFQQGFKTNFTEYML